MKLVFPATFDINLEYKKLNRVFSTCENVDEIFETLRKRFRRNCCAQIGHMGSNFPIGRLRVNMVCVDQNQGSA